MEPTFETLLELAGSNEADPIRADPDIRSLAGACLLAFAVAYGDSGKMLMTASAMLMGHQGGGTEALTVCQILEVHLFF